MVVDLMDASGTLMGRVSTETPPEQLSSSRAVWDPHAQVREMVGSNPIVLVGTKMDLLPAGTHPKVRQWQTAKALQSVSMVHASMHAGCC